MSTEHTHTDPLDPTYYAARGATDPVEQQMRADAAREDRLMKESRAAETLDELDKCSDSAKEIRSRWVKHDSHTVRQNWGYLADARADWRSSPATMERFHDRILDDRVNGHSSAMSPVQWRSQQQAREMSDRGQWSEVRDPFSSTAALERSADPADPTNPDYYAESTPDRGEQVMRADFALVSELGEKRDSTPFGDEYTHTVAAMNRINESWENDEALGREWQDMRILTSDAYLDHREFSELVEDVEYNRPQTREADQLFGRSVDQAQDLMDIQRPILIVDANRIPGSSAQSELDTFHDRGNAFAGLSDNAFEQGDRKGMAR